MQRMKGQKTMTYDFFTLRDNVTVYNMSTHGGERNIQVNNIFQHTLCTRDNEGTMSVEAAYITMDIIVSNVIKG